MNKLISDPIFLEAAGTIVLAIIGVVQSTKWWQDRKNRVHGKIMSYLGLGVQQVYLDYVQALKKSGHGVSIGEAAKARADAWKSAEEFAAVDGVTLGDHVPKEQRDLWVQTAFNAIKRSDK